MRAAQSRNGSNGELRIDGIEPAEATHPVAAARILKIRRELLHATFNIRKNKATRLRHEATVASLVDRLQTESDKLKPWHVRDIKGRIAEATARAELCVESEKQYDMEIALLRASLCYREPTPFVRLRRWLSLKLWT